MGWVIFEVLLAFGIAVFIVWWTFPRPKKKPSETATADKDSAASTKANDSPH
jgi:hypothetical protein